MAAVRMRITYVEDGRVEVVRLTPRAQVDAEEHFHGMNDETAVRTSYWLAWRSLYLAGREKDPYEVWLDKIDDAEAVDEQADTKAMDPTGGAAPSPNGSSPSVSEPVSASTT